jgi:hypothetical protein
VDDIDCDVPHPCDFDGDGCTDLVDQHPLSAMVPVGFCSGFCCTPENNKIYAFEGVDTDGDGLLDCMDLDDDDDGVADADDPCPLLPADACSLFLPCSCDCIEFNNCLLIPCIDCVLTPELCVGLFLKVFEIDPASLTIGVFDDVVIAGGEFWIAPPAGRDVSAAGALILGGGDCLPPDCSGAGRGAAHRRLRLELWARDRDGSERRFSVLAEYAPEEVAVGDLRQGKWLHLTPPTTDGLPLSIEASWYPGAGSETPLPDRDVDGAPDAFDNCPDAPNRDQADGDMDGAGDACDGPFLVYITRVLPSTTRANASNSPLNNAPLVEVPVGSASAEVVAAVSLRSNLSGEGVRAWSLSVLTQECFELLEATTAGTAGAEASVDPAGRRRGGFERTEIVNPARNDGRRGAVSAVVLAFSEAAMLPPVGEELVLRLRGAVDASMLEQPGDRSLPCVLGPLPGEELGLVGSGQPVPTVATVGSESRFPETHGAAAVLVGVPPARQFAGDCNQDQRIDIADAPCLFGFLFVGRPGRLPCGDGAAADPGNLALLDWNGDARIDISDGIGELNYLFIGGPHHWRGRECVSMPGCPDRCAR